MATKKLYSYQEITSAIYYDVIELMGEEGLDSLLTAYDLLAVMAAPCTRLDYDNTDSTKRTSLMIAVHSFMSRNQHITSLAKRELVTELNRSFLPTLTEERQQELLSSFKMVMGFDADGYAIFNKKYYDVYKGNMDKGVYTEINYGALPSSSTTSDLPERVVSFTYQMKYDYYKYELHLHMTVSNWIDVLRGASPKAMQLIGAYSKMKDRTASHSEIEEKFGILRETINGVVAGLGNRAKRLMGIEVLDINGNPCCWILPFNNGREERNRGFVWELRREVYLAYEYIKSHK